MHSDIYIYIYVVHVFDATKLHEKQEKLPKNNNFYLYFSLNGKSFPQAAEGKYCLTYFGLWRGSAELFAYNESHELTQGRRIHASLSVE